MADDDLIEIRVPMIVTADGYWAAMGSHRSAADKDPDWSGIDEMCDYDNPTVNPQRYWITAYVRRPKVGEVPGAAVRDCPQESASE
ncbi:hypothetical protein [Bradyrhizobium sp. 141]|uniref:hypothetical protein n=1 Tax=Bradyrhizobium sp. 141 TaxID=2782617 RepID=UPI001FFB73C1|nr:hypothetical protein [Bradyrhizobium sp. 141]MCK1717202.1 hypothetical protein [Bradyrhizobium sp. 141]